MVSGSNSVGVRSGIRECCFTVHVVSNVSCMSKVVLRISEVVLQKSEVNKRGGVRTRSTI